MWSRLKTAWKLAKVAPVLLDAPEWNAMDAAQLRQFLTTTEAGAKYLLMLRQCALEQTMKCATTDGHDKALYVNGVAAGAVTIVGVIDDLSQMHE